MPNPTKSIFHGTSTTLVTTTAAVADTEVVGGQNELNNTTELYNKAKVEIRCLDGFGGAPTGPIDVFIVRSDGTNDGTALDYGALVTTDNQTSPENAEYLCSFHPPDSGAFRDYKIVDIEGVERCNGYIQNNTGQSISYTDDAIELIITPMSTEYTS